MSETKTIEERYEEIKQIAAPRNLLGRAALDLLDDLMAEREKLKERLDRQREELTSLEFEVWTLRGVRPHST